MAVAASPATWQPGFSQSCNTGLPLPSMMCLLMPLAFACVLLCLGCSSCFSGLISFYSLFTPQLMRHLLWEASRLPQLPASDLSAAAAPLCCTLHPPTLLLSVLVSFPYFKYATLSPTPGFAHAILSAWNTLSLPCFPVGLLIIIWASAQTSSHNGFSC